MESTRRLEAYPGLARWYAGQRHAPPSSELIADHFVFRTCEAMRRDDTECVRIWIDELRRLWERSPAPLQDFLKIREVLQDCGAEILQLASEFGEHAMNGGLGSAFMAAMQVSADVTGLVAFRFLSAWTALNSGELETCVNECDKIDEPHAPVLTLQGQAFLELGRASEAIDALTSAVTLVPDELLAWFQLAKAHHVVGQWRDAWTALGRCRLLAPQSDEVALLTALSALAAPQDAPREQMLKEAFVALSTHLPALADNVVIVVTLIQLCIQGDNKEGALKTVQGAAWERLATQRETYTQLAPLLLGLKDKQWFDVVSALLARMTATDKQIN